MKTLSNFSLTKIIPLIALFLTLVSYSSNAQKKNNFDLAKLNKENKLVAFNKNITYTKNGEKDGVALDGIAWIKDVDFSEGIIEVDLRGKDLFQQSFLGIAFHGVDTVTYDAIYFRPFNFQPSDTGRRKRAVQYISHPSHSWHVLRESFPGKYENAIIPTPLPEDWFHVKIEVKNENVTVFVNYADKPTLTVKKLNGRKKGLIGLWSVGSGDFTNLSISRF